MSIAKRLYYEPFTTNANHHLHSLSKVTVQNKSEQPRHRFGGDHTMYYLGGRNMTTKQQKLIQKGVRSKLVGRGHTKTQTKEMLNIAKELDGAVKAHTSQANRLRKIAH